jgi:hypothetical protein
MAHPDRAARPATYEDLVKVPDHLVAEILDGELYATPRPAPRDAAASSALVVLLGARSIMAAAGRAAGGFCSSPNCISAMTSPFRTWSGGGASGCPRCPSVPIGPRHRTGYARCCRHRRRPLTARRSSPSMRGSAWPTSGLSIQLPARSKSCGSAPVAGRSFQFSPSEIPRAHCPLSSLTDQRSFAIRRSARECQRQWCRPAHSRGRRRLRR